jgi:hypothetical protein
MINPGRAPGQMHLIRLIPLEKEIVSVMAELCPALKFGPLEKGVEKGMHFR